MTNKTLYITQKPAHAIHDVPFVLLRTKQRQAADPVIKGKRKRPMLLTQKSQQWSLYIPV
jgi:hypothetical protein